MLFIMNNKYHCNVCGFVHTRSEKELWICHYCLEHKIIRPLDLFSQPVYYNYGFVKRDILICEDCIQHDRKSFTDMQRIAPVVIIGYAYEAICRVIKVHTTMASNNTNDDNPIDYYQAVRIAYRESQFLRQLLNIDSHEKIDKDLKTLWPFTYRIMNQEKERIMIINEDPDNLLISWIPRKLTRLEEQT